MERQSSEIPRSLHLGVSFPAAALTNAGMCVFHYVLLPLTAHSGRAGSAPCPCPCRTRSHTRHWSPCSGPGSSPDRRRTSDRQVGVKETKRWRANEVFSRENAVWPHGSVWTGSSRDNACGAMTAILTETSHFFLSVFAVTILLRSFKKAADCGSRRQLRR